MFELVAMELHINVAMVRARMLAGQPFVGMLFRDQHVQSLFDGWNKPRIVDRLGPLVPAFVVMRKKPCLSAISIDAHAQGGTSGIQHLSETMTNRLPRLVD